jgi:hypothetical protein
MKTGITVRTYIGDPQNVPVESLSLDEFYGYVRSATRNELVRVLVELFVLVKESNQLRDGLGQPVRDGRVDVPKPLSNHEGTFLFPEKDDPAT